MQPIFADPETGTGRISRSLGAVKPITYARKCSLSPFLLQLRRIALLDPDDGDGSEVLDKPEVEECERGDLNPHG